MNAKDRLLKFIEHLGVGQGAFEKECEISNGYINNNKGSFGSTIVNRIHNKHPELNLEWLTTGEGEMILPEKNEQEATIYNNSTFLLVPLVSQYAYAGYLSGFADNEYIETLPTVPFFGDHEAKGEYMAFETKGDSMDDESADAIKEGDILIGRKIKQEHWRNKLHIRKWDFIIIHKTDGILIKRIISHNIETAEITIHSLNPDYEDKVLSLNDVSQLLNVIQVSRNRKR